MPAPHILCVLLAGVTYGYWDAHFPSKIEAQVTARVITPWGMWFDSMETFKPVENGQLFLRVDWTQPKEELVSSIDVAGEIMEGDQVVTKFRQPCRRVGSTWLVDAKWGGLHGPGLLHQTVQGDPTISTGVSREHGRDRTRDKRHVSKILGRDQAVSRPLRCVTWLNEKVAATREVISAPFQRQ